MSHRTQNLQRAREAQSRRRGRAQDIVSHGQKHRASLRLRLEQVENKLFELQLKIIQHNTIEWLCEQLLQNVEQQIQLAKLKLCKIHLIHISFFT